MNMNATISRLSPLRVVVLTQDKDRGPRFSSEEVARRMFPGAKVEVVSTVEASTEPGIRCDVVYVVRDCAAEVVEALLPLLLSDPHSLKLVVREWVQPDAGGNGTV